MADPINLAVGDVAQLNARLTRASPGPVGDDLVPTWSSSNAGIAALMNYATPPGATTTGMDVTVKGVAPGAATITLTLGSFTDSMVVNVSASPEANVASVAIVVSPG